jgi:ketosteroid isomerase-like protein
VTDGQTNVDLVRRGLDCVARGDVDGLIALWSEDMTYYAIDEDGPPTELHGRKEFLDMMENGHMMVPTHTYDVIDVRPAGSDLVVVHLRLHATSARTGQSIEGDYVGIFRIKDGQLVEGWDFVSHETQLFLAQCWA